MTDIIDRGCELEDMHREAALAIRKPAGPKPTGFCLLCDEPLPAGQRWCGANCRDEWERPRLRRGAQ